uniref:Uncharacterized protein n=1 Tax=Rhodnius prolixus TaxID=13249 RepID=T1HJX6_RHOPR
MSNNRALRSGDRLENGSLINLQALTGESLLEKERRLSEMILQLQMVRDQLLNQQQLHTKVHRGNRNSFDEMKCLVGVIFKLRGQLLNLNFNVARDEAVHLCSMCNQFAVEDTFHYVSVCPVLSEFRVRWLGKKALSESECIEYLNGSDWDKLYNYHMRAWKYRSFLIQEYNT